MPETSVDKNHLSARPENHVGLAWEVFAVEAISEAERVDKPPDDHLWLSVAVSDPRHSLRPLFST
jgi:hypothetical protein